QRLELFPGLGRRDLQRIGGIVVRQHRAVAVEDQTPVGNDWNDGDPVVLGERMVVLVLQDLDIEEPGNQQKEDEQYGASAEREAHLEVVQLPLMVAQLGAPAAAEDDRIALLAGCEAAKDTHPRPHRDPLSAAAESG